MAFPPLSTWSLLPKNETLVFLRAIIIDHLFSTQRLGCICGFVNFVVFQTTLLLFPVSTSRHLLQFVLSLSPVPHRSGRKCSLWGCDDTAPGPLSGHKLHLTSTPRTPPSPLRQLGDSFGIGTIGTVGVISKVVTTLHHAHLVVVKVPNPLPQASKAGNLSNFVVTCSPKTPPSQMKTGKKSKNVLASDLDSSLYRFPPRGLRGENSGQT